jgi:uncharacterized RDD family membrane protein YckC
MASSHGSGAAGRASNFGDYRVLTPERVSLDYDVAGVGSRSAAAIVDAAIQWFALAILVIAMFAVGAAGAGVGGAANVPDDVLGPLLFVLLAVGLVIAAAILLAYHLVFEIVWNGQTPGKRLLGLRVIRENGYPLRAADAVVRNLVRIVDSLGYVGLVVMLFNDRARRLGDFAAGTVVVREGGRRTLAAITAGSQAGTGAARLRAEDATLVRDFLVRRGSMQPEPRARLAERLAGALARRYGLDGQRSGHASDEAFLEDLVGSAES